MTKRIPVFIVAFIQARYGMAACIRSGFSAHAIKVQTIDTKRTTDRLRLCPADAQCRVSKNERQGIVTTTRYDRVIKTEA